MGKESQSEHGGWTVQQQQPVLSVQSLIFRSCPEALNNASLQRSGAGKEQYPSAEHQQQDEFPVLISQIDVETPECVFLPSKALQSNALSHNSPTKSNPQVQLQRRSALPTVEPRRAPV